MTFIWKPHWKHEKVDMERCRASVHDNAGVGFHQCTRKPAVTVDGIGYCKQHSPQEEERRNNERRERIDASIKEMDRRNEATYARIRVVELVKELRDSGWVVTADLRRELDAAIRKAGEQ